MKAPKSFVETVTVSPGKLDLMKTTTEAFGGGLPEILYPEIRAITANKVTRNKTFYPVEFLRGDVQRGDGIASMLYPYPIPILRDHNTGGGFDGPAEVYGRAKYVNIVEDGGVAYVSLIPAITDPKAIEMILTERFLTVSIGVDCDAVHCSICGNELTEGDCDHRKGRVYIINGQPKECYWVIGPVSFHEVSFVTVPSDTEARVLRKNVENLFIFGGESKSFGEVIMDEKFNQTKAYSSSIIESAADADSVCTLGDLYDLDSNDPLFDKEDLFDTDEATSTEAKLTTKQRKALPASTFCGPGRSFPANDSCLSGDTLIPLLSGESIRIDEVQPRLDIGEDLWVYSFDLKQKSIVPAKILKAWKTISSSETLKITLDNNRQIICTKNHPFLKRNLEYSPADSLVVGESLVPLYRKQKEVFNTKPYEQVYQPWYGFWEQTSKMVIRQVEGPKEVGTVVHHKDQNVNNNTPKNLEYLTKEAHLRLHQKNWSNLPRIPKVTTKELLSAFTKERMKTLLASNELLEKHTTAISKGRRTYDWDTPTNIIGTSGLNLYDLILLVDLGVHKSWLSGIVGVDPSTITAWITKSGVSVEESLKFSNISAELVENFFYDTFKYDLKELHKELCLGKSYVQLQEISGIDRETIKSWFKKAGYEVDKLYARIVNSGVIVQDLRELWRSGKVSTSVLSKKYNASEYTIQSAMQASYVPSSNHKIIAIEEGPLVDVYDLEVQDTHNFALSSGIFVHNSHAAQGLRMLGRYKGPGDKNKIRACLLRKSAQFKKSTDKQFALGYIKDNKYAVEFPIFPVTKSNIIQTFSALSASNFTAPQKEQMERRLARFCAETKSARPIELKSLEEGVTEEETSPVTIILNEDTYPLLYTVMDAMETYLLEVSMSKELDKEQTSSEQTSTTTEITEGVVENKPLETTSEETPREAVTETVATEEVETTESLKATITALQEEASILNETCLSAREAYHFRLAQEVALLFKVLKRKAGEADLASVTESLVARSTQSLEDTLEDLLKDFEGQPQPSQGETLVDKLAKLESKVTNPALFVNEGEGADQKVYTPADIKVDPNTGKMMLDAVIEETELEDSTYLLFTGKDKEKFMQAVEKRITI